MSAPTLSDNILLRLHESSIPILREGLEACRRERDLKELARRMESTVLAALGVRETTARICTWARQRIRAGDTSLEEIGWTLQGAFDASVRILEEALELARQSAARGYFPPQAAELGEALADVLRMKRALAADWPVGVPGGIIPGLEPDQVERSLAEADTGQLRSLQEVLAELRGPAGAV